MGSWYTWSLFSPGQLGAARSPEKGRKVVGQVRKLEAQLLDAVVRQNRGEDRRVEKALGTQNVASAGGKTFLAPSLLLPHCFSKRLEKRPLYVPTCNEV